SIMPATIRPSVDLPQPDSPTRPTTSPLAISRLTSSTARVSAEGRVSRSFCSQGSSTPSLTWPKVFDTWLTRISGTFIASVIEPLPFREPRPDDSNAPDDRPPVHPAPASYRRLRCFAGNATRTLSRRSMTADWASCRRFVATAALLHYWRAGSGSGPGCMDAAGCPAPDLPYRLPQFFRHTSHANRQRVRRPPKDHG